MNHDSTILHIQSLYMHMTIKPVNNVRVDHILCIKVPGHALPQGPGPDIQLSHFSSIGINSDWNIMGLHGDLHDLHGIFKLGHQQIVKIHLESVGITVHLGWSSEAGRIPPLLSP